MEAVNIIKGLGLYFYKVAENSQDVFWVRSADFNTHLYVNRAFEYVWKIAVDALYKQPRLWFDCIPVDQQQHILAQLESWVSSPTIDDVYTMEYPILDDDGNETLISDSACPIFHNGECVGFSGVASIKGGAPTSNNMVARPIINTANRSIIGNTNKDYAVTSYDQTSLKPFKQDSPILAPWADESASFPAQKNTSSIELQQEKTRFLSMVSHELRTPLNAILGMTQIMQQDKLKQSQSDQLEVILQSGKNLLRNVNNIINYARMGKNDHNDPDNRFCIVELAQQSLADAEVHAAKHHIKFILEPDASLPKAILADKHKIKQLIDNLLSNAVMHTLQGKIILKLDAQKHEQEDTICLRISVEDTGVGMHQSDIDKIFHQHKQWSSNNSPPNAGIGLTIVQEIAQAMSGQLSIESKISKGSCFTCTLILKAIIEPQLKTQATGSQQSSKRFNLKVLVVEDNPINQKVIKIMLEQLGCDVTIAQDGLTGVEKMNNTFDVVFMDIGLPDIDGLEATKRIRINNEHDSSIPIIAMTAHLFSQDKQNCLNIGMNEVISKPVLREDLINLLNTWTEKKQTEV